MPIVTDPGFFHNTCSPWPGFALDSATLPDDLHLLEYTFTPLHSDSTFDSRAPAAVSACLWPSVDSIYFSHSEPCFYDSVDSTLSGLAPASALRLDGA